MDRARYRITELDLRIVDAVAPQKHATRFVHLFRATLEDLLEILEIA